MKEAPVLPQRVHADDALQRWEWRGARANGCVVKVTSSLEHLMHLFSYLSILQVTDAKVDLQKVNPDENFLKTCVAQEGL